MTPPPPLSVGSLALMRIEDSPNWAWLMCGACCLLVAGRRGCNIHLHAGGFFKGESGSASRVLSVGQQRVKGGFGAAPRSFGWRFSPEKLAVGGREQGVAADQELSKEGSSSQWGNPSPNIEQELDLGPRVTVRGACVSGAQALSGMAASCSMVLPNEARTVTKP